MKIDVHGASDIGRQRTENQDHFMIADLRRQLIVRQTDLPKKGETELFGKQDGCLFVVADGMGGHHGGELASRTAIEVSARYVLDMMHWFLKLSPDNEDDFEDELSNCLRSVQDQIWSMDDGQHRRMGTTVTMAYLLWPRLFVVHAGDSRCYLLRNGELRQLTTDHTIAQQLIDSGGMSPDDEGLMRWRHVLWNCVGGGDKIVCPEAFRCLLQPGDKVLLCSDGLTTMLDDAKISSILQSTKDSRAAVLQLLKQANGAGGEDNITVIVGSVREGDT